MSAKREHCNGEDRLAIAILKHEGAAVNVIINACLRLRDTVAYRASASASFRLSNPNSAKFTSAGYYYS